LNAENNDPQGEKIEADSEGEAKTLAPVTEAQDHHDMVAAEAEAAILVMADEVEATAVAAAKIGDKTDAPQG
jgi:hypothetical protein